MVNLNRPFTRGFTVASFDEADSEIDLPDNVHLPGRNKSSEPRTTVATTGVGEEAAFKPEMNMMRRGSKSLPASPMGSPKAVRKNPYFTGIFTSAQNASEHNRGWLSSLLGVQREVTQSTTSSTTNIAEETERETIEYESRGVAFGQQQQPQQQQERVSSITSVFRTTKPSEIREMNFWSPTSM